MALLLPVEAHEVKEGYWRLQRGLSDEGDLLARLEYVAGIVRIHSELGQRHKTNQRIGVILIAQALYKLSLIWIASVFAPHSLKVHSTYRTVKTKNSVNLNEVCT
jgi:hypothetical protein